MRSLAIGAIVCASLLGSGCATRIGDLTVASTKNFDIRDGGHTVDTSKRLVGRDTIHIVVLFPTGMYPNMEEAMDNAIEQAPGAVGLADMSIKHGSWYIPLIYGQDYYEVEGSPIYEGDEQASAPRRASGIEAGW